jgi:Methyltransferase domain
MRIDIERQLMAAGKLSREAGRAGSVPCKICGKPALFFDLVDFNKVAGETNYYVFGPVGVPVAYHRCSECGFLFTPFFDDWSADDFRRFVYNADYPMVDPEYAEQRPRRTAERLAGILQGFAEAHILDYGSGSGIFARSMAERGFPNVQEYDPFSHPVSPAGRFHVIVCNEVLEHSPDPLNTMHAMRALLDDDGCIILGQSLQPTDIERLRANWWYCAPRNGHCSTFAERTLSVMAAKEELLFHRGGTLIFRRQGATRARDLTRRLNASEPFLSMTLGVASGVAGDGLHATEPGRSSRFRWTARESHAWTVNVGSDEPATLEIRLPFIMEVEPGFAARCAVSVGSQEARVKVNESSILAEAQHVARARSQ